MHILVYKSHGIIKNYRYFFSICLEERNVFASFDEIPSMTV